MNKSRIEHVFLVRVWREAGAKSTWRGCVDHVHSGKREYFGAFGALVRTIEEQLGGAAAMDGHDGFNGFGREGPPR